MAIPQEDFNEALKKISDQDYHVLLNYTDWVPN